MTTTSTLSLSEAAFLSILHQIGFDDWQPGNGPRIWDAMYSSFIKEVQANYSLDQDEAVKLVDESIDTLSQEFGFDSESFRHNARPDCDDQTNRFRFIVGFLRGRQPILQKEMGNIAETACTVQF